MTEKKFVRNMAVNIIKDNIREKKKIETKLEII
jgi:hypothetical protein